MKTHKNSSQKQQLLASKKPMKFNTNAQSFDFDFDTPQNIDFFAGIPNQLQQQQNNFYNNNKSYNNNYKGQQQYNNNISSSKNYNNSNKNSKSVDSCSSQKQEFESEETNDSTKGGTECSCEIELNNNNNQQKQKQYNNNTQKKQQLQQCNNINCPQNNNNKSNHKSSIDTYKTTEPNHNQDSIQRKENINIEINSSKNKQQQQLLKNKELLNTENNNENNYNININNNISQEENEFYSEQEEVQETEQKQQSQNDSLLLLQQQQKEHKLFQKYQFFYQPRGKILLKINQNNKNENMFQEYKSKTHKIGEASTLEGFLKIFLNIKKPSEWQDQHKISIFKDDNQPFWENYSEGGCLILKIPKHKYADQMDIIWKDLVYACMGGHFRKTNPEIDENIMGLLMNIRSNENFLELWLKNSAYKFETALAIKKYLNANDKQPFYFKLHKKSIKSQSIQKELEELRYSAETNTFSEYYNYNRYNNYYKKRVQ